MEKKTNDFSEVIAFTGHRPQKIGGFVPNNELGNWVQNELDIFVKSAIKAKQDRMFVVGGALGTDTKAAKSVAKFGGNYCIAIACNNVGAVWSESQKKEFYATVKDAQVRALVPMCRKQGKAGMLTYKEFMKSEELNLFPYNTWCLNDRNKWMIEHAGILCAVWDGSTGGTANAVALAKKKGMRIYLIDPKNKTRGWVKPEPTLPGI